MAQLANVTPLSPDSPRKMIFNTGTIFYDVEIPDLMNLSPAVGLDPYIRQWNAEGKNLGATTGDGTLTMGVSTEVIDTNDMRVPIAGMYFVSETFAEISVTIQQLDEENYARIAPTSFTDPETGAMMFGVNTPQQDRFKTIACVWHRGDGGYRMVILLNAFNSETIAQTITNLGVHNVPVTFRGNVMTLEEADALPVMVFDFPHDGEDQGINALAQKIETNTRIRNVED